MHTIFDEVDYGPLAQLLGKWIGTKGIDKAPDSDAQDDLNEYTDELTFSLAGPAENAEEQELVALRYHHLVRKNENGLTFHDQIGHWIYEPSTGLVMHSLTIPRGVCVFAGGTYDDCDGIATFRVSAEIGSDSYGIIQSPFMLEKARTTSFRMTMKVKGNTLSYKEVTMLRIYGKDFTHSDQSTLHKVSYDLD
ncbi:MAG: heme-binding beta-barrel domain-containing protein [Lentisphaeria bacterium]|nr:heme-binding beta-barrel domain-containing protein [Lentisphaeria bacterium]